MDTLYFDQVIVGGGIFGIYTSLYLADQKMSVLLIEKDPALFQRASAINQARLHGGYHYPRSVATARVARDSQQRFVRDHQWLVNTHFDQFYAVERSGSFTAAEQFVAFCEYLHIPLKEVPSPSYFNASNFEALFLTREYSFDCQQLSAYYIARIAETPSVEVRTQTTIKEVSRSGIEWHLLLENQDNHKISQIRTRSVINATYSGINRVNKQFGFENEQITHELTEVVLATSSVKNVGLTIIDGDFASFMPYGLTDLVSLSSVRYTSHFESRHEDPTFPCQRLNTVCLPENCRICNDCAARPQSNQSKMMHQMGKYLNPDFKLKYIRSLYTIKSKLTGSYIDDSRPTVVKSLSRKPDFHCILGGKVSSIYEIEKYFNA